MHCPQCGLEQIVTETRFCRKCGFELKEVKELLVPETKLARGRDRHRTAAFNQGVGLLILSLVVVIVMTLARELELIPSSEVYMKLIAGLLVLAGLARMFLPYVFDGIAKKASEGRAATTTQLPLSLPPEKPSATEWATPVPDTAETVEVGSVTERTTRKLESENN